MALKFINYLRLFLILASVSSLASLGWAHDELKKVSVLAFIDHPAIEKVRAGILFELEQQGFQPNRNLHWHFQSAQGSLTNATQIVRKYIGQKTDVIVAIGTPAAQAALAASKDLPIVFTAVTDPQEAKLTTSQELHGENITGVTDRLDIQRQLQLIRQLLPRAKKLAVLYHPGEANSIAVIQQIHQQVAEYDFELVTATANRSSDVGLVAATLVGKADVIYSITDNLVTAAYESLVKICNQAKVPLIAANGDEVARGAIAALALDYREQGQQTGKIIAAILRGKKPAQIPIQNAADLQLYLNLRAAKLQGVSLPAELIQQTNKVIK